jgi:hypothetical protein
LNDGSHVNQASRNDAGDVSFVGPATMAHIPASASQITAWEHLQASLITHVYNQWFHGRLQWLKKASFSRLKYDSDPYKVMGTVIPLGYDD